MRGTFAYQCETILLWLRLRLLYNHLNIGKITDEQWCEQVQLIQES